ncbi:plasmid mobilization protein [Burkholderia cepacia]|uniref:Plasmid mobilization relaxosome protein MobC n=1 Tax=Burkholderia cepacia TaxID=292 RepID=A0A8I1ANH0_BURCE|nr:plasmid mobilization relaxosome protein MobC [Burkholderia cepacia]MBA9949506.1 plasmid mobilization relaxosome protein MobC [Burkholderia cepacia]MBA9976442.1 plasmid mobilization relaxosome protein MobC [Burkholderia cepacia]MBA9997186.1 plasmid mobilization relaxosome protein MobC [Burkholderia cepacia]MBB0002226.1 plasmid mobilization relaxosome protein MobC [Burkholderia cepacia]
MPKDQRIEFKLSAHEKSILQEKMQRWGFDNASEFLRCLIRSDDSLYLPVRSKLIYEINKIGANLNQITKHLNDKNQIHVMLLTDVAKIRNDLVVTRSSFEESVKLERKNRR